MAVIGTNALTFADWASRYGADTNVGAIIELLSQNNEIMYDMLTMEGNLVTGHKTTVRTGLPTPTWRLLNYGVQPSKSTTAPITDTCGNLEAFTQVDKDLADLNGDTARFRLSETAAELEAMSQNMASTLIYGNTSVNPERFMGLTPRYNTLTTTTAQTAYNVLGAGGTGSDNTSIWIVTWGDRTTHGIFPKGKKAGLSHQDMGIWPVADGQTPTGYYMAYRDHYKWELGLTVRDWRYNVRICNIDVSDLNTTAAANLITLLTRAVYRLPTTSPMVTNNQRSDAPTIQGNMGRTVIYCNRVVKTYLDLQAQNKSNVLLQLQQWDGMNVLTFRGIPIRTVDAILNNETLVS
jgi:hypothetical protein